MWIIVYIDPSANSSLLDMFLTEILQTLQWLTYIYKCIIINKEMTARKGKCLSSSQWCSSAYQRKVRKLDNQQRCETLVKTCNFSGEVCGTLIFSDLAV